MLNLKEINYLRVDEGSEDGDGSSEGINRLDGCVEDNDGRDND